ncbi:carbohydrate kinase family protein [Lactonifactor longoviformis]|uniref:Sugar or nucleoside kinase, ribokinase family n=1 Tax=Lactonifactor longoviformis DSM 17459 TaxID=1122155 RepID=A0A1M4U2J0_9CLOT|nr:carbohydrate kinase family protein [Lactonifactor longoviformis]POP32846.1 carbohydrate kinase family protein [Lactonifactor longoviformis]SHE50834.1 Sugar or nucleoside kinase, ribokinase family [Lactonifactor longoviformis DSM 17459]
MDYIVASTAVTDEIRFSDGKTVEKVAGGAGIYALCGMKLWSDSVLLATGVGADYREIYGEWYETNKISMEGLLVKDEKTPHTVIQYFEDGERTETPLYGPDHYKKIEITPEDLKPYFSASKGIYIFKNDSPDFWEKILVMKKESPAAVMWEIANDATCLEKKEHVREIASRLDILSINMTEARALLGLERKEDIIQEFQSWNLKLVFLRQGARGAVMITPKEAVEVPSCQGVKVMDPTGGGNSSSGAVLCGYCQGYSPAECGRMGSISAAMCISQYGVPKRIQKEEQEEALRLLKSMEELTC